jgi:hypothetical protein
MSVPMLSSTGLDDVGRLCAHRGSSLDSPHPIPNGLTKCAACGEYRGKVHASALNWNWERPDDPERRIGVTCLCDGILCSRCKRNKIHRPITIPCAECQSKEQAPALKTTKR